MEVTVVFKDGKYPSYNVGLASREGAKPFLEIKGCKLMNGSKGQFVSYPSRKQDDGKYWNHVWASDDFNKVVIQKMLEATPQSQKPRGKGIEDIEDSIPF